MLLKGISLKTRKQFPCFADQRLSNNKINVGLISQFNALHHIAFLRFLQKYLSDYHYISPSKSGNHDVGEALKKFQNFFHLPETGEVDEETLNAMKKPRCGDPDLEEEASRFKRYDAVGSWSKTTFKWYIQYSGEDLSESDQQKAIADAFAKWKGACSALSFTQTTDAGNTDFDIRLEETFLFLFLFVLFSLALICFRSCLLFVLLFGWNN